MASIIGLANVADAAHQITVILGEIRDDVKIIRQEISRIREHMEHMESTSRRTQ